MSDRAEMFTTIQPGYGGGDEPGTPRNVPNRGGAENPSAAALRAQFGAAVQRVEVVNGETNVVLDMARVPPPLCIFGILYSPRLISFRKTSR